MCAVLATSLCLALILPAAAHALVAKREQLGVLDSGETVVLRLDDLISPSRLRVEIDGIAIETPVGVSGMSVTVRIPEGLVGTTHDISLYEDHAFGSQFLGSWEFSLAGESSNYSVSIQAESGSVSDGDRQRDFTSFGGRVDFDIDEGRFRGGLSFTRTEDPDPFTGDFLIIDDIFLEARMALWGDEFYTRLGSHFFSVEGNLLDEGARRGLSFRLVDPSSAYDVSVFALQATQSTEPRNLSGLEDPDDLLLGVTGQILPSSSGEVRLSFAGYDGASPELPNGKGGATKGFGLALTAPFLGGSSDFYLSYDQTQWMDGTREKNGRAYEAALTFQLLPQEDERDLIFSVGYSYSDLDYFSALNPDHISGEAGYSASLYYATYAWELALNGEVYDTNAGGPSNFPVERVKDLTFTATYTPQIFTGGFLNGTSFFFEAEVQEQKRLFSPPNATLPNDQTLHLLAFGVNRFREDHSFALLYSYEHLDYHRDAKTTAPFATGLDTTTHGIDFLLTYAPNDRFDATFGLAVKNRKTANVDWWEKRASLGFTYGLVPDRLDYILEAGIADYNTNTSANSRYLRQELEWGFHEDHSLVLSAEYMKGNWSKRLLPGDGWLFGLSLRTDFGRAVFR